MFLGWRGFLAVRSDAMIHLTNVVLGSVLGMVNLDLNRCVAELESMQKIVEMFIFIYMAFVCNITVNHYYICKNIHNVDSTLTQICTWLHFSVGSAKAQRELRREAGWQVGFATWAAESSHLFSAERCASEARSKAPPHDDRRCWVAPADFSNRMTHSIFGGKKGSARRVNQLFNDMQDVIRFSLLSAAWHELEVSSMV